MDFEQNSTVRILDEELVAPRKKPVLVSPPSQSTSAPTAPEQPSSTLDQTLAVFRALGYALSARALLLLSLIGAFVLATMAMSAQTPASLEVLVAYALFTVIPVAFLEIRKRQ